MRTSFTLIALLAMTATAWSQPVIEPGKPKLTHEEFLSYSAMAAVAELRCENVMVSPGYVQGFLDATGLRDIQVPLHPDFSRYMAKSEKETEAFCKLMLMSFFSAPDTHPKIAPLLIKKTPQ